jgi:hypothetical protein
VRPPPSTGAELVPAYDRTGVWAFNGGAPETLDTQRFRQRGRAFRRTKPSGNSSPQTRRWGTA